MRKKRISEVIIDTISLLFREGQIKKSLSILIETLEDHIFSADSYFKFAELLIKQDYNHEAQTLLETACKHHPKTAGLFALLSSVYKKINMNKKIKCVHQKLLDIYFEQLKINPDRNDIRLSISDVFRYEEKYIDALDILDEIEETDSYFMNLNKKKGQVYEAMGNQRQADLLYQKEKDLQKGAYVS